MSVSLSRLCHGHKRHHALSLFNSAPRRRNNECAVLRRERRRLLSVAASRCPPTRQLDASGVPCRVHLPTLGQNGTLVLHSESGALAEVRIVSQWRDDSLLEAISLSPEDDVAAAEERKGDGIVTLEEASSSPSSITFGPLHLTSHPDGIATSLGRNGTLVKVKIGCAADAAPFRIVATVPEKVNVTCRLARGDIDAAGKLEGDAHLATADGAIVVAKLRGHKVTLDATTLNTENGDPWPQRTGAARGVIHVRKAIEARTVRIDAPTRVRARMVNGSDVSIRVAPPTHAGTAPRCGRLDDDDECAAIDVGSLYVSGGATDNEARLTVEDGRGNDSATAGLVRVKSSHGHVTIRARTGRGRAPPPSTGGEGRRPAALIDLGGVNGSCDVELTSPPVTASSPPAPPASVADDSHIDDVTTRVHFDSLTPESISTITTRGDGFGRAGTVSVTADRKAEAEVRLLSVVGAASPLPPGVDAHAFAGEEAGEVRPVVQEVKNAAQDRGGGALTGGNGQSISIMTDAYEGEWGLEAAGLEGPGEGGCPHGTALPSGVVQYTQGTLRNRSGEPDSRFDVQSRGKINIDGAASQALHGFQGNRTVEEEGSSSALPLPLLVVASEGKIKLETLSWFGSIARRYGLEEEKKDLGQRASRSDRLEEQRSDKSN